jgi:1-acyl-sn-glycerol-3-phosphate acyltransferase
MMSYQPSGDFSWDRVFRPSFMSRLLSFLGLQKDAVVRFLNFPSFALVILIFIPYLILAPIIRLVAGEKAAYKIQPLFGWLWLAAFGIYRRRFYHPHVRTDESYIIMAEHFSLHDIPIYRTTWPGDTRALSAKEYATVPMYGWIIRTAGTQFIERRDTAQAIADLEALKGKMARDGISVLMVPTGTRAPTGQPLPFKKGVFHFSVALKRPIVPMYLIGLEHLKVGKNFTRPGRVDVVYGAPIRPENHPEAFADVEALRKLVEERMLTEGRELRRNRALLAEGGLLAKFQ